MKLFTSKGILRDRMPLLLFQKDMLPCTVDIKRLRLYETDKGLKKKKKGTKMERIP